MATKRPGTTRTKDAAKKRTGSPARVTTTSPIMAGKLQKAVKANQIDEVRALLDRGVNDR